MVKPKIAPSMLSSDFADDSLRCGLATHGYYDTKPGKYLRCNQVFPSQKYNDWIFCADVCCTFYCHFVPNLKIGAPVTESLRKHTAAYLDCHLMVTNPLDYVEPFGKAGASGFTFHVEASKDNWLELVKKIKSPGTPIEEVYPLLDNENPVEMVLVMTVEPGFGGKKFMAEMMDKVDGGLGPSTIDLAASAGANCIVAGSSVFGASDPAHVIALMRKSIEDAQKTS